MLRLAGPLIEERKVKLAADKNYADKPVCNLADYNVCTPIGCADKLVYLSERLFDVDPRRRASWLRADDRRLGHSSSPDELRRYSYI